MDALGRIAGLAALGLIVAACPGPSVDDGRGLATRGYILISLDTLRADRLGAYGYARETSPFFDRLAARGTLFERVAAPYPATLVSHMSIFTGLYPPQHGVYPPAGVLPDSIPTLTDHFQAAGFRTEAHTEGGFVAKGYGFERGFEAYDDSAAGNESDVEATFKRGLDFISGLEPEESFLLFLHTYAIHDPYDPPRDLALHYDSAAEPAPDSRGERLRDFNLGRASIDPVEVARFSDRYDASIRYVDSVLERFVSELQTMGVLDETTLVVTSDHGEEFLEHGKLAHTQLFPEVLEVPLLVVLPDETIGRRVSDQVSLVDLAPTLLDLAGLAPLPAAAGRSLTPYFDGGDLQISELAYAEVDDSTYRRALLGEIDGVRHELLVAGRTPDVDGSWVERRAEFDIFGSELVFRGRSFHEPRSVRVSVDGVEVANLEVLPEWGDFAVSLPGEGLQRVEVEADACLRPNEVMASEDGRCLGVLVDGPALLSARLFNLEDDPRALRDISKERPLVTRRMLRELEAREWAAVGEAAVRELSDKDRQRLKALGYLD